MGILTTVMAIDPGDRHVGMAIWSYPVGMDAFEMDASSALSYTRLALEELHRPVLVIEEFRLFPGKIKPGNPMETSQLIGALKLTAKQVGVAVVMQGPGIKKPMRRQLQARRIKQVGNGSHARDAELHAWHYILRNLKEGIE